jgi:hypothetical protein
MSAYQFEQTRIAEYQRGFNDAMRGRAPRSQSLTYALGYLDAKR